MIPLFELEAHREAEDDPRWKVRILARNAIMVCAALIVPLGSVMIIAALLLGDMDTQTPRPGIVMVTAMLHLFLGAFSVLGAMYVHQTGMYLFSAFIAIGSQLGNFLVFVYFTFVWLWN